MFQPAYNAQKELLRSPATCITWFLCVLLLINLNKIIEVTIALN